MSGLPVFSQDSHPKQSPPPLQPEETSTPQVEGFRPDVARHLSIFSSRYAAVYNMQDVEAHMEMLNNMERRLSQVDAQHKGQQYIVSCEPLTRNCPAEGSGTVKIIIICLDIPKIFNHINMVLGHLTLSTIEASIMSTTTGLAFDEFISKVDGNYASQCNKLENDILSLLLSTPINTVSTIKPTNTTVLPTTTTTNNVSITISTQKEVIPRHDEQGEASQCDYQRSNLTFSSLTSSDVQVVRTIGVGQVCETFEGVLVSSNMPVAIKKPLASCTGDADSRAKYSQLWEQELALMKHIGHHPNICTFIGLSQYAHNDNIDVSFASMFMCYEYLSGGCLADLVADPARLINPLKVAGEVACGMSHLHNLGVMHRDLKPANVILDSSGIAKIADFGLSCRITKGSEMTAETGTYRWMAPEVIRHERYSFAADVYSFGILLWELYSRSRPFDDLTPVQAAYSVALHHTRPPLPPPSIMPEVIVPLLEQAWHREADSRPTFAEIYLTVNTLLLDEKVATRSDHNVFKHNIFDD